MRWGNNPWKKQVDTECCEPLKKFHDHVHRHHLEFMQYHRWFRYARPAVLLFNLIILYLLFSWAGFKAAGICFAVLIVIKEIVQFFFLLRLEKRIITPIEELRQGVDEIAGGNYDVRVECHIPNDLGLLIASFNEMARKLQQGEKMQAEYEENRKTLVANISHDLKTPITSIQGYIEALLESSVDSAEKRDKYLKIIHHNVDYLNRLIDDLFLFSKLDMQKLDFHFERICIRKYLTDLMEEYHLELGERQIQFGFQDELTGDSTVSLDAKRFYQAINNIVRNAVGHGPDQGLLVRVKLYRRDNWIAIDIEDNGPGIPEDKLPYIFDRFYRIDTERAKDYKGTGLGLAITKELVKAHGGEVAVTSLKDQGTCFTIMLPESIESEGAG
jgi:signal transduction histidine kinase